MRCLLTLACSESESTPVYKTYAGLPRHGAVLHGGEGTTVRCTNVHSSAMEEAGVSLAILHWVGRSY